MKINETGNAEPGVYTRDKNGDEYRGEGEARKPVTKALPRRSLRAKPPNVGQTDQIDHDLDHLDR